jgi:hypothetical protein
VTDDVTHPKPVFNSAILKENDDALIMSGIVDKDDDKKLILMEIGDTPWLLEQDPTYKPSKYLEWSWKYNTGNQLSRRVGTIAEAQKAIILPDDVRSTIGYLLKVMPSNFTPTTTSDGDLKILMSQPNPLDYGLTLDDLVILSMYGIEGEGCKPMCVKRSVMTMPRAAQFKLDLTTYNEAIKRFKHREPQTWDKICSNTNSRILIGANEQVYLKGSVYNKYASADAANLMVWHQVLGETTKLRLPIR